MPENPSAQTDSSELGQILARLDALESREAIRALVTAYAVACDQHDMPRLMSLFTEDAVFDSPNGRMAARGRDAIEAMFIDTFKIRGPAFHWTHDVTVTLDPQAPEIASGLVYSHAETTPNGVVSLAAMRYQDVYQRQQGQWRIRNRTISFLYYVPAAEYCSALNQTDRVLMSGQRMPADYPEALPCWQEFERTHGGEQA